MKVKPEKLGTLLTEFADYLSEAELKVSELQTKISSVIVKKRLEMHMTQKEFADYMEVTQGMVSKWESEDYNFTIESLVNICHKLGIEVDILMQSLTNKYKNIMKSKDALAKLQLLGTSIKKLSIENDFVTLYDKDIKKEVRIGYEIEDMDSDGRELFGTTILEIDVEIKNKNQEKMSIHLALEGGFSCEAEKASESSFEEFENLLNINGCASLYSIARSIVTVITAQAYGGEPILLPMLNMFKVNNNLKSEENFSIGSSISVKH